MFVVAIKQTSDDSYPVVKKLQLNEQYYQYGQNDSYSGDPVFAVLQVPKDLIRWRKQDNGIKKIKSTSFCHQDIMI